MRIKLEYIENKINEQSKVSCKLNLKDKDLEKIEKIIKPYKNKIQLAVAKLVDMFKK